MYSKSSTINNKKKIFNDPVYGFISIPHEIIFDIIEHPYFQRLRRIRQLGLTDLVYPGALHTRFHHVLGAMHLMMTAITTIRRKGTEITEQEEKAVLLAILLHDIGHGPFSHALEHDIVSGVSHEDISGFFIERLSKEFDGELDLALRVFKNEYPKTFLHQLVSSQLDMDRMDYLNRDSFYTGVSEGKIGTDRIIEMMNVRNNELVMEEKSIYSIEKFIVARRLMYWQVYLHKTVVSAEFMLIHVLQRAKELVKQGEDLHCSVALRFFLERNIRKEDFIENPDVLEQFSRLDDYDIFEGIKAWQFHHDPTLSELSARIINRDLFKIKISKTPYSETEIEKLKVELSRQLNLPMEQMKHFVYTERLVNNAYNESKENINVLLKSERIVDFAQQSDNLSLSALSKPVEKFFLCYPVVE